MARILFLYTRMRMVSKGVYKYLSIQPLVKSSAKYRGNQPDDNKGLILSFENM